jgi:hypothetical protein
VTIIRITNLDDFFGVLPSGKHTYLLKMAIEIVDLPIKNGGSFHSFVNVYQSVPHDKPEFPPPWAVTGCQARLNFVGRGGGSDQHGIGTGGAVHAAWFVRWYQRWRKHTPFL